MKKLGIFIFLILSMSLFINKTPVKAYSNYSNVNIKKIIQSFNTQFVKYGLVCGKAINMKGKNAAPEEINIGNKYYTYKIIETSSNEDLPEILAINKQTGTPYILSEGDTMSFETIKEYIKDQNEIFDSTNNSENNATSKSKNTNTPPFTTSTDSLSSAEKLTTRILTETSNKPSNNLYNYMNKHFISKISSEKNLSNGTLTFNIKLKNSINDNEPINASFNLDPGPPYKNIPYGNGNKCIISMPGQNFLVRFFDINKNQLTSFVTEPLCRLSSHYDKKKQKFVIPTSISISYNINMVYLREIKYVEIGFFENN